MTNGMNVSRRDLFKFGGLAAITAAGAGALAGCAPQQKMASTGAAAAEDGSTYVGPSFLQKPAEITEFDEEHTYDVVVVGAGESGLSAMHAALEAGATVGALQSLSIVQTAGNMGASIDLTKTNEAGIKAVLSFINYKSDYRANLGQVETWARNSQEALAWWAEAAAKGGSESKPYDYTVNCNGHEVFFHANTYFHDEGHQKGALVIGDAVQAEGAEIFFETPCVQLLVEDGRVAGAIGETKDGAHVLLRANKGVIMAAGDYVGDSEMLYYYTPDAKGLHQAVDFRNGTGLKAAMWAGAQMCPASHTKMVHGEGPKVRFEMPYLFLDRHGKRFMDENNTYVVKARTTALQTLDNQAWVIVDSECPVLDKVIAKFDRLHSPYGKADTIEELCKQVNLPEKNVVKGVKAYNDALAAGKLEEMVPPCTYKKPHPVAKAPFYAVPFQGGMTATFGGPLINTKAEIQSLDGGSIPGLYAAGNAAGGIFFFNYAGGAQLGAATVYGRIAGRELANRAKQN